MSRHSQHIALALAPVLSLGAAAAFAHTGHVGDTSGFAAGFAHPLLGLDHLLAMLAIGLWSVRQGSGQRRLTPWIVLGGMWLGAALAWGGLALPGVETGIAVSVLLAGVLIATLAKLPSALGVPLIVAFMLFHGYAHGSGLPQEASLLAYLAGFSLSTLAITYGGKAAGGWLMRREARWSRILGAAIAAIGGGFVLG